METLTKDILVRPRPPPTATSRTFVPLVRRTRFPHTKDSFPHLGSSREITDFGGGEVKIDSDK